MKFSLSPPETSLFPVAGWWLIATISCVLALGTCADAQIIQDGNFADSGYPSNYNVQAGSTLTVNGWTFGAVGGNNTVGAVQYQNGGTDGAAHHIQLNSNNPSNGGQVYAETTMSGLATGQKYLISFALESAGGGSAYAAVYLNGSATPTQTYTVGNSAWVTESFTFIATGSSEAVQFQDNRSLPGSDMLNLTAVSVVAATPEANSIGAAILLLFGIGCVERRRIRARITGMFQRFPRE